MANTGYWSRSVSGVSSAGPRRSSFDCKRGPEAAVKQYSCGRRTRSGSDGSTPSWPWVGPRSPTAVVLGFGAIGKAAIWPVLRAGGFKVVGVSRSQNSDELWLKVTGNAGTYTLRADDGANLTCIVAHDHSRVVASYVDAALVFVSLLKGDVENGLVPLAEGVVARYREKKPVLPVFVAINGCSEADVASALRAAVEKYVPSAEVAKVMEGVDIIGALPDQVCQRQGEIVLTEAPQGPLVVGCGRRDVAPRLPGTRQVPDKEFKKRVKAKLWAVNTIHAVIAYRGADKYDTIPEALDDEEIRQAAAKILKGEVALVLLKTGMPPEQVGEYVSTLLARFSRMKDPVERVGRDPERKLGRYERLVGPAMACLKEGIWPEGLIDVIACAIIYGSRHDENSHIKKALAAKGVDGTLAELASLYPEQDAHAKQLVEAVTKRFAERTNGGEAKKTFVGYSCQFLEMLHTLCATALEWVVD